MRMRRFFAFAALSLCMVLGLAAFDGDPSGCDDKPSTDGKIAQAQEQIQNRGNEQVGLPNIIHYTELRRAKRIYELRDQERVATYTYTYDMAGHLHKFCDSIGYPLPYATQYSNPEKRYPNSTYTQYGYNIPQSEPNGLFMPTSADGTWVECINPRNPNQTGVVYSEPHVITSPWPLGTE